MCVHVCARACACVQYARNNEKYKRVILADMTSRASKARFSLALSVGIIVKFALNK